MEQVWAVQIAKSVLKATSRRLSTWQLAASVAVGFAVGMLPTSSPLFLICLAIGWVAPIHPLVFLVATLCTTFIAGPMAPLLHHIGTWSLSDAPWASLWDRWLMMPLVPWLGLQNSVVNGAIVFGSLSIIPIAVTISPLARLLSEELKPIGATEPAEVAEDSQPQIVATHAQEKESQNTAFEIEQKARNRAILEEIAAEVLFDSSESQGRLENVDAVLLDLDHSPEMMNAGVAASVFHPVEEVHSGGVAASKEVKSIPGPHVSPNSERSSQQKKSNGNEFRNLEPIQRLEKLLQECRDESQQHDAASVLARATVMTDMIDELLDTIENETRPFLGAMPSPHFAADSAQTQRQDRQAANETLNVGGTQPPTPVDRTTGNAQTIQENGGREVCISTQEFETRVEITRSAHASAKDAIMMRPSVAIGGHSESKKTMNQIQLAGHQRRTIVGQPTDSVPAAKGLPSIPNEGTEQQMESTQPRSTEEVLRNLLSHIRELKQKS